MAHATNSRVGPGELGVVDRWGGMDCDASLKGQKSMIVVVIETDGTINIVMEVSWEKKTSLGFARTRE